MLKKAVNFRSIFFPILMLMTMWITFFLQHIGFFRDCTGAIIPLSLDGLAGIVLSPLLHGDLSHIAANSLPIVVLMFMLFNFYEDIAGRIFVMGWVFTGLFLWFLPPINPFTGNYDYYCVIGASGIIYMLAFFIFLSGLFRRTEKLLVISLVVVLYYGSLIWGILPEQLFSGQTGSTISWQAHLCGAITGCMLAIIYRGKREVKKKFIWEYPNYYSEKDDLLWQRYKEAHPEEFEEMPYRKESWSDHLPKQ